MRTKVILMAVDLAAQWVGYMSDGRVRETI